MATLESILKSNARYVAMSGFEVIVDEGLPTVSIDDGSSDFFMQEDEAAQFLGEANDLWQEVGTLSLQVVRLAMAKDYLDCL